MQDGFDSRRKAVFNHLSSDGIHSFIDALNSELGRRLKTYAFVMRKASYKTGPPWKIVTMIPLVYTHTGWSASNEKEFISSYVMYGYFSHDGMPEGPELKIEFNVDEGFTNLDDCIKSFDAHRTNIDASVPDKFLVRNMMESDASIADQGWLVDELAKRLLDYGYAPTKARNRAILALQEHVGQIDIDVIMENIISKD